MSSPKVNAYDYINFLIASPKNISGLEASKVQPNLEDPPSHDSFNRLLYRLKPSTSTLWHEAKPHVRLEEGLLIIDDSTLDKPYSKKIDLVTRHWSGKHHRTVPGINLVSLLWSGGDEHIPCDYRIYSKSEDGKTKHDHFMSLIQKAKERQMKPKYICFDSWYASLKNLKMLRSYEYQWFSRLPANRQVNLDGTGNKALSELPLEEQGTLVHLKGYGFIKVFKIEVTEDHIEYWATSDLEMTELQRLSLSERVWKIEHYHRGIKQFCGIERCQARGALAQKNHILLALRAFLRLEIYSLRTWESWFEAKMKIIRQAITNYLANPFYLLKPTA